MKLTSKEILDQFAFEAGISKREASKILTALSEVFQRSMVAGHEIVLPRIGRFKRSVSVNSGGVKSNKKTRNVIYFKASRTLLDRMRKR
jgi:nucleoid DNA-binding protein